MYSSTYKWSVGIASDNEQFITIYARWCLPLAKIDRTSGRKCNENVTLEKTDFIITYNSFVLFLNVNILDRLI